MRRISVIGFGKIGQAIAAHVLNHGINVTAVDTDPALITSFEKGEYFTNEPGIQSILTSAYAEKNLKITGDFSAIEGSDAVIVAIPLLIDQDKTILDKPFIDCLSSIARFCNNSLAVIIETSVPVGFCRNKILPAMIETGKKHGEDFLLAHSPERIKSGTMMEQLHIVPKIIGGIDDEALDKAAEVYKLFFKGELLKKVESIEAAELLKLAGMIYRDVAIALSNQLAQFADAKGINFADLVPLINTDREANLLYPGIGVGGHCTPVYPYFLIDNFKKEGLDFSLAQQCRGINDGMAEYALSLVANKIKNKDALILGLGFRPNVKEDSLSTTYRLHDVLMKSGYRVSVHDVEFSAAEIASKDLKPAKDIYETNAEVVFLVTMHRQYQDIDFNKLSASGVKFFVDGRNAVDRGKVESAGINYFGIGR